LVAGLRQRIIHRVTPADLDEIVDNLVILAKGGDLGATKLLLGYLVGKPAAVVNPDTLDVEEWKIRAQAPTPDETEAVLARMPADLANALGDGYRKVHLGIAGEELDKSLARVPLGQEG